MITPMSRKILPLLSLILLSAIILLPAMKTQAQAGTAAQMIAAVNQLRANNGLAPLQEHPILMSIAQSHSEYQASRGQGGHYGPGGSSPKDRAIAAGFGSEASGYIAVSENWAAGNNLSINRAIYEFWNDAAHMGTMLGTQYQYIGAGVAYDGNYVYYTVDTGGWAGDSSPNPDQPTSQAATSQPTTTAVPVVQSTPNPDGSITHIVQAGQTLYTIAVVYDIPLEELMAMNGFTENTILYLGDSVIIHPADAPTSPPALTATPSPSPSQSATPTATTAAAPTATRPHTSPTSPPPIPPPEFTSPASKDPAVIIAAVLVAGAAILVTLIRSFIRK